MANLIIDRIGNVTQGSSLGIAKSVDIARAQKHVIENIEQPNTKDSNEKHKTKPSKIICQAGLMGAGAILLYLGLKTPSKMKIFKDGVKNKIFRMSNAVLFLDRKVTSIASEAFPKTENAVQEYLQKKRVNPQDYIAPFEQITDAKEVVATKNTVFNSVQDVVYNTYKGGPSDFDEMANMVKSERNQALDKVWDEAQKTRMKLKDCATIPSFEDKKHEDLIEVAREELAARSEILNKRIDELDLTDLDKATNKIYSKVGEAVEDVRKTAVDTKKQVMDVAFSKVRELLDLGEDFVPSYDKKYYDLTNFKSIKSKYLRALDIPKDIADVYSGSQYLKMLESVNFNKLSRNDVVDLYKEVTPEKNLTELRLLIDGLRLEQAIAEANGSKSAKAISTMVEKLKFLSNEFQMVGNDILYESCMQDFSKIPVASRGAKIFGIYTSARKLGFNTIFDLNNYFVKLCHNNNSVNLSTYIEDFRANPKKYL